MYRNGIVWMVVLTAIVGAALAQPTEWDRAWEFRDQIGLSPTDLAALGVEVEVQEELAEAVRDYFADAELPGGGQAEASAIASIDALTEANRVLTKTVSWGRNPRTAFDRLRTRRAAVIETLSSPTDTARGLLPEDLRPYVARAIANVGIDSPYRLLDLTAEQRSQIIALQERRDTITKDARQWHRTNHLASVREQFAEAVYDLLTAEQQDELDEFTENVEANLDDVWDVELADYPTEELAQADPRDGDQLLQYAWTHMQALAQRLGQLGAQIAAQPLAATATPPHPELGG